MVGGDQVPPWHVGRPGDGGTCLRLDGDCALGDSAVLNFPEYRAFAQERAPRDIRFVTMAEEREHRQAEHQLRVRQRQEQQVDPLVQALLQDPQVMADQYLWFGGGTGQQRDQEAGPSGTSQQHDHEAGPSGTSQQETGPSGTCQQSDEEEFSDGVDWDALAEESD